MNARRCFRCGTKSTGQFCDCCGDDLDEQAAEQAELETEARAYYAGLAAEAQEGGDDEQG